MENSKIILRGPSLVDVVADQIRNEIKSNAYAIGDRLPTEKELTETYGVSRPIVREAIGVLKRDGLIASRQGLGAFVVDNAEAAFRMKSPAQNDTEEIANVIELLMAFEATATALAATRRSEAELKDIFASLKGMEKAIANGEAGVEEDVAFHRAIADASGNPYFREMMSFLDKRARNFIRTARENTARVHADLIDEVQHEHQKIYDAIAAQDPALARKAAEAHLRGAAKRLQLYIAPVGD